MNGLRSVAGVAGALLTAVTIVRARACASTGTSKNPSASQTQQPHPQNDQKRHSVGSVARASWLAQQASGIQIRCTMTLPGIARAHLLHSFARITGM